MKLQKLLSIKYLKAAIAKRLVSFPFWLNRVTGRIVFMPIAGVSVTGKCNSRCGSCGIWNGPEDELPPSVIEKSVAGLKRLGLKYVIISGGEPLIRDDLFDVIGRLSGHGLEFILCTNGMLLGKYREEVLKRFHGVVVSLDSHEHSGYKAIRGVEAFNEVISGIRSITERGMRVTIAHTLQKGNIRHLIDFIRFVKKLNIYSLSIRPLDAYSEGFGSAYGRLLERNGILPSEDEVAEFSQILARVREEFTEDLASGFITPNIRGLFKIRDYFQATTDSDSFPVVRCQAPYSSCVIESNGDVKPCFFSEPFGNLNGMPIADWKKFINSDRGRKARRELHKNSAICRKCAYPYIWL